MTSFQHYNHTGGSIFIVMREEYLSYVQEYVGKLEPYMNNLAQDGIWRQVQRVVETA
jgi:chitinase